MTNLVTRANAKVGALTIGGVPLTATATELNRVADASTRVINGTAAGTLTITEATHDGKIVLLNRAGGFTTVLPAATGSGAKLTFIVATTTTTGYIIQVTGNDNMIGNAVVLTDNAGTVTSFLTAGTMDTITLNGSTTAGRIGDSVEAFDIAADTWWIRVMASATGNEATPFTNAVS
jgi:hypothetical protein